MKFRTLLAAATCLALPVVAHAQPVTGPYVSLGAGTSIENPTATKATEKFSTRFSEQFSGRDQYKPSYAGAAAFGYGFGDGFRVELSGDFIRNTLSAEDNSTSYVVNGVSRYTSPTTHSKAYGGEDKYGPMVNVLYDIPVGLPVFPYVGGGVGYQWVKLDSNFTDGRSPAVSGTAGSFAYDLIAGVAYPLPMVPGLSLTAQYQFMQLVETRSYDLEVPSRLPAAKADIGQESSHTFLIGLRYQLFNAPVMAPAPAPAPMAAPAPAPAKTYLVFFDWDKYNLTPRATQIIAEAASDSKTTKVTTITVSGYTDTSGTPTYNQGLSVRRAKAVAVKLMADGVPASEISIFAYGETHLLVPTGPGVREPQNRRVEIVLK